MLKNVISLVGGWIIACRPNNCWLVRKCSKLLLNVNALFIPQESSDCWLICAHYSYLHAWFWLFGLCLCSVGEPGEEWTQGFGSGSGVWWAGSSDGEPGLLNQFSGGLCCDPTLLRSDMICLPELKICLRGFNTFVSLQLNIAGNIMLKLLHSKNQLSSSSAISQRSSNMSNKQNAHFIRFCLSLYKCHAATCKCSISGFLKIPQL